MKNLTIKANVLIIAIIILIFNSCKNKDCHEDGTCPPEFYRIRMGEPKNYLWSLPGSYWIYKNTATGELDTQTCTSFYFDSIDTRGTLNYSSHILLKYDVIERTIKSSFNKWSYYDRTEDNTPDSRYFNNGTTIFIRTTDNPGIIHPFFYPFAMGTISGTGSSNSTCIGMDSTLILQGKTYTNVAKFDIDMDDIWYSTQKYPNAIYYWARNVGLINRFNKTENFSWELIEYDIKK